MTAVLDDHPAADATRPPLRVALTSDCDDSGLVVVRRPTLQEAQRVRSLLRSGGRLSTGVVLEIEAAVAPHPASARASVIAAGVTDDPETVRYVGTPHGLYTLINDVYAAEVADAVLITPIDGSATTARVRELLLPLFAA